MRHALILLGVIVAVLFIGFLAERALDAMLIEQRHADYPSYDVEDSPCHMTWDNGMALDAEDCAYMGGGGWDD